MGARCFDPTTLGCSYVDTWTPLLSLRAMILGTSIFSRGNNAELWMEGYHSFHARYLIGGYVADSWFVGDIYFGLSQFSTSPPPVEPTPFTTGFQFVSIDLPVPAVSGRAVFTPTPIPLPGSVWLIALAYLVAMPVFRHRYT